MALTLAVRMEATIIDEMDIQAETSVYALVDPAASFETIIAQFNAWLTDLDACSDGQIIGAELEVLPALSGLKTAPVAGSRVEQTGILAFDAEGDSHQWATAIPALSNSPIVVNGGKVVTTTGAPAQVLASLLAGGGTAQLAWTNSASQALSALISFRRYPHQLEQITYERG